jgi:hypothetical protein
MGWSLFVFTGALIIAVVGVFSSLIELSRGHRFRAFAAFALGVKPFPLSLVLFIVMVDLKGLHISP